MEAWPELPAPGGRVLRRWSPASVADLPVIRDELRAALADGVGRSEAADVVVLLLDELLSNGLRHGRPPVVAELRASDREWVFEVSDQASSAAPTPDRERDRAQGGMGLLLVSGLASAYGWAVQGERKSVWGAVAIA